MKVAISISLVPPHIAAGFGLPLFSLKIFTCILLLVTSNVIGFLLGSIYFHSPMNDSYSALLRE